MMLAVLQFQASTIIIRRIEFKFYSCHLPIIDHLDQKKKKAKVFFKTFQYYSTSNTLQLILKFKFIFTLTPMTEAFTSD